MDLKAVLPQDASNSFHSISPSRQGLYVTCDRGSLESLVLLTGRRGSERRGMIVQVVESAGI